MKNKIKLFATALMIFGLAGISFAQESATATASATIVTPISIAKTADMNFGNVAVQSATSGTVVLSPEGNRTSTGGVTLPVTATGTVTAASFDVMGQPNYGYAVTLPGSVTLTRSSGTETMTADSFTSTPTLVGTLSEEGVQTLNIGATLNVAGAQAAGTYISDNFTVTVNYN